MAGRSELISYRWGPDPWPAIRSQWNVQAARTLLAPVPPPPIRPLDWPLPQRPFQFSRGYQVGVSELVTLFPVPAYDWPIYWDIPTTRSVTFGGPPGFAPPPPSQNPSFNYPWPLPQVPFREYQTRFHRLPGRQQVLPPPPSPPPSQYDWPLPQRGPAQFDRGFGFQFQPIFTLIPLPTYDWPAGPDVRPNDPWPAIKSQSNVSQGLPQPTPFLQTDWPLPQAPQQALRIQYWQGLQMPPSTLQWIAQYDWPLPKVAYQPVRGWGQAPPEVMIATQQPVGTFDWPTPKVPVRDNSLLSWPTPLLPLPIAAPPQPPPNQYDWPIPQTAPRASSLNTHISTRGNQLVDVIYGGRGLDWSPPRGPDQFNRGYLQRPMLSLFVSPLPKNQYDWPLPNAPVYVNQLRDWRDQLRLTLFGRDQFFGAPGQSPNYDWPLPKRPDYSVTLRWGVQSSNILQPRLQQVFTYHWPLPQRAVQPDRSWIQQLNYALAPPPQPPPPLSAQWPLPIVQPFPQNLRNWAVPPLQVKMPDMVPTVAPTVEWFEGDYQSPPWMASNFGSPPWRDLSEVVGPIKPPPPIPLTGGDDSGTPPVPIEGGGDQPQKPEGV